MTFNAAELERMAGGVKQTFIYHTADPIATVQASGYFSAAVNQLRRFDIILCVSSTGGTPVVDPLAITSVTGAVPVTVTAGETLMELDLTIPGDDQTEEVAKREAKTEAAEAKRIEDEKRQEAFENQQGSGMERRRTERRDRQKAADRDAKEAEKKAKDDARASQSKEAAEREQGEVERGENDRGDKSGSVKTPERGSPGAKEPNRR
jgi:hypothetical protein